MSNIKRGRGRGRPPGTGLDDSPTLRKIADLFAADQAMKVTRAIKRVLEQPSETTVRRLQGKWKEQGARYLADARARRAAVPATPRRVSSPYSPRTARQLFETQRRMQEALSPAVLASNQLMSSPAMTAAQEAARRLQESPAVRAAQELANSPAFLAAQEAARRIHESPTMRAMRELQESPTMRAVREAHEKMERLLRGY